MIRYIIVSLFFVLLTLAASPPALEWDGGQTGNQQAPEADSPEITDFASLQEIFNQDAGYVRLVALLSPSCGYCIKGYRYMRKILEEVPDERLKMYVVWEPMLSGDTKQLAERMSRRATDPRMVYQAWDNERITGRAWQASMDLQGIAWDVYFLYASDIEWDEDGPSQPDYWQHQGAGGQDNWLNYDNLKANVEGMLAQAN